MFPESGLTSRSTGHELYFDFFVLIQNSGNRFPDSKEGIIIIMNSEIEMDHSSVYIYIFF